MAFPTVTASAISKEASYTSTHTVTIPGSPASGDMLWVSTSFFPISNPTVPAGWTLIEEIDTGNRTLYSIAKISDGTETTVDITTAATHVSVSAAKLITGVHGSLVEGTGWSKGTFVSGNGTSINCPPVTAAWGVDDNLTLAVMGAENDGETVTAYPTGFTHHQIADTAAGGVTDNDCTIGSSSRQLAAATDDPSLYNISGSEGYIGQTYMLRPAVASGADIGITSATNATCTQGDTAVAVNIGYENFGPDNSGSFDVEYPIPAGATFNAAASTAGCSVVGGDVVCTVAGPVANGGTGTVTVAFDVSPTAPLGGQTIVAAITGQSVTDPTSGNDTDSTTFTINELVVATVGDVRIGGGMSVNDSTQVDFVPNLDLPQTDSNIRVFWDLDGDGDFDEPEEDITSFVTSMDTQTGRNPASLLKGQVGPGRFSASLNNFDDRFSKYNQDSVLNTEPFSLRSGGTIRIQTVETAETDPVLLSRYVFDEAKGITTDDLGNAWTITEGGFNVTAEGASPTTSDENDATVDIGQADFFAQIYVPYWQRPNRIGILYRYDDSDNYGFVGMTPFGTTSAEVYVSETIAGAFTLGTSVKTPQRESFYFSLEVVGNNLKVAVNGVTIIDEDTVRASSSTVVGFESQWEGKTPARIGEFFCWDKRPAEIEGVLWTGRATDIKPTVNSSGKKQAELTAEGFMTGAAEADIRTLDTLGSYRGRTGLPTAEFAAYAFGRAGLLHPPGPYSNEHFMGGRGRVNSKAITAARQAEDIEFGRIYEMNEGPLAFRSRSTKDGQVARSSWTDIKGDQFNYETIELLETKREIITEVTAEVAPQAPIVLAGQNVGNDHVAGIGDITLPALAIGGLGLEVGDLMIVTLFTTIYEENETWESPPGWVFLLNEQGPQRVKVLAKVLTEDNFPTISAATFYRADNPSAGSWEASIGWYTDWFGDIQNGVNVSSVGVGEPDSSNIAASGQLSMPPVVNPWGAEPTHHQIYISGMDANNTNNPVVTTASEDTIPDSFWAPATGFRAGVENGHTIGYNSAYRADADAITYPGDFKVPPTGFDHLEYIDIAIRGDGREPVTTKKRASTLQIGSESSYELSGVGFPSPEEAETYNKAVIARFGSDRPALKIGFTATKRPDYRAQAVRRRVGDRIHISAKERAGLGIEGDYIIETINHRLSNGNKFWFVEWGLAPA